MSYFTPFLIVALSLVLAGCRASNETLAIESSSADKKSDLPVPLDNPKAQLGSQLFFDVNLSKNRNQSCASCHDIGRAFVDGRETVDFGAVSLGSDDASHGERNAPTAGYAALAPIFHKMKNGDYRGGQFWDGRAANLADQAAGPFVNPVEMQMESESAVVDRVLENPAYERLFKELYGESVFAAKDKAFNAITDAIAHFEQTELFMPFDSKYDRVMRGEERYTPEEELGRTLFFSQQFTNCNACHQLNSSPFYPKETFTNYEYRNIGVPRNPNLALATLDEGLFDNPLVNEEAQRGKFKVPSLRNVAVTGPYMHNGVFKDLRTVILFYDHYNNPMRKLNPETGLPWQAPEVPENIDLESLEIGPPLDNRRVDALEAFLKTLTDQRYEYLLTE